MATTHATGVTTFTTPSDRELVATRVIEAPRKLAWDISTKPEHLKRWLVGPDGATMAVCEVDLRPGGAWRWVWRQPDGSEMELHGIYKEIDPPRRLVNTELWGGDWPEALSTLVLTEEDGLTTLTTTVRYESREIRDKAIGTGMKEGWSQTYDRLDEYLHALT